MSTEVRLETYPQVWRLGYELVDAKVTLGQQESSSSCEVSIADPSGSIASDLVKHSLDSGGIKKIPSSKSPQANKGTNDTPIAVGTGVSPSNAKDWESAIVAECSKQGITDKRQIAYILATAKHESGNFVYTEEIASGAEYEGNSDLGNISPGDGKRFKGRGLVQVTGRRNYTYWSKRLGKDFVANPDLLKKPEYALVTLVVGMKEGVYTGTKLSDAFGASENLTRARDIVNPGDYGTPINTYYSQYLSGGNISGTQASQKTVGKPEAFSSDTVAAEGVFKGNKLLVTLYDQTFEFYHQGTEASNKGITSLKGQGIRWVLNRRKRSRTAKEISLKTLATQITKANGLKLSWLADKDYDYIYVDQTNLTDYQLLLRECKRVGLLLSESQGTLTVKGLRQIKDSQLVLAPGLNLISWEVKDEALDTKKAEEGSALSQEEAKTDIDPLTGQIGETAVPEVDPVKDLSVSGKSQKNAGGTLAPGQDGIAAQESSRVKRVKGLPSAFVIPMDALSLTLEPLMAIRTKGLPNTFNRVWMIDKVTHDLKDGTTKLECYSPVEVTVEASEISSEPVVAQGKPGVYILPLKGATVTSLPGFRIHPITGVSKYHAGADLAAPTGTPVWSASDGTVAGVEFDPDGYGNFITITHPDGYTTRYAHLNSTSVRTGQRVKQGQVIGTVGSTGGSTGSHLHFELRTSNGFGQEGVVPYEKVGLHLSPGQTI